MSNRRTFLKYASLLSASSMMPGFLKGLSLHGLNKGGRKLVILQLSGGNDGLNSIIPYRNDVYYALRPQLAIAAKEVLKLDEDLGLNPALAPLQALYDQGHLSVLHQVGYPNPDRSHFRAMDIWHTASDADAYWETGWLGRYLDHCCAGKTGPPQVLEIDQGLSLAVKGAEKKALAVMNSRQLNQSLKDPYFQAQLAGYQASFGTGDELDYLYKTMTETQASAAYVHAQHKTYRSSQSYPATALGRQLKLVSELICAGAETSVYYVSLSGFDTHVRQKGQQARLLTQYAEAVAAFAKDLRQAGRWKETLVMTFSEFGRRVKENASGGTDHGKANTLLLMGGNLAQPGAYNPAPDLQKLDEGDLLHTIDFRQVYATLLQDWLGVASEPILRGKFEPLRLV